MALKILPVIMSGGSGTRLWPISTKQKPKQFHALGTKNTMIQETAMRLSDDIFLNPFIICGEAHVEHVIPQLIEIGHSPSKIILEPCARNTAAVAGVAALMAQSHDNDCLVLLLPADHIVTNKEAFVKAIMKAANVAQDNIVTFGITPSNPETGYGYIHRGEQLDEGVYSIARFCEKPNHSTAKQYVDSGEYSWNAGIFLFSPQAMVREMEKYSPEVLLACKGAVDKSLTARNIVTLDAEEFEKSPSDSIDYAIMEKTKKSAVVPCDIGWADVGSFAELWRLGDKDEYGNQTNGVTVTIDAHDCLVISDNIPVSIIGLSDIMVVVTETGILVAPKQRSQDIKKVVKELEGIVIC